MPADTPPQLRGNLYSTHLTQRCLTFDKCIFCSQCTKYDKNNVVCTYCESRKNPKSGAHHCTCGDKRNIVRQLEQHYGKAFHDGVGVAASWNQNIADDSHGVEITKSIREKFADVGVTAVETMEDSGTIKI